MTPGNCKGGLSPQSHRLAGEGVGYFSRGAMLIICDGPFDPAPLYRVGVPGRAVVVSPLALESGPTPGEGEIQHVQGRVASLRGWLGAFRPELTDLAAGTPRRLGPNRDGTFDVVIDLSAKPLIERSVAPFGYFAPRGPEHLVAALAQSEKLVGAFTKPKYFDYERGLCAHSSFGQAGCTRCLEVCGAGAIRSAGDHIAVDTHLCQGCAACTLACPTGALSFNALTRAALLEQVERTLEPCGDLQPTLVVHPPGCEPSVSPAVHWVGLAIEPVAAFGEELWLAALAQGAGRIVLVVDPATPAETMDLLAARVELAGTLLRACGHEADAIRVVAGPGVIAGAIGENAVRRQRRAPVGDVSLPTHHKRVMLTRSLARLEPEDGFDPMPLGAGAPFGTIEIDEQLCTLCSACARICPTAAIRFADDTESVSARLTFAEDACVQCSACANGCPEGAIRLEPRIAPLSTRGYWRVVSEGLLARCIDCSRPFLPEKMLDANIRRLEAAQAPAATAEQLRRCPHCRHRRTSEGFGPSRPR